MGNLFCSCNSGQPNLGQPGCLDTFSYDMRLIFTPIRNSDGDFNEIVDADFTGGILPEAFILGKINEADDSKKWSITEPFKTPTVEREDKVTQEIDGVPYFVREGNLLYTGTFYGGVASPKYSGRLNGMRCKDAGIWSIDIAGNMKGKYVDNGTGTFVFRPRGIEKGTLYAKYKEPTPEEVQNIELTFMISVTEIDSDLNYLAASKIGTDMKRVEGVKDVTITASGETATTVDANMVYIYGQAFVPQPHQGVVDADVVLFNETTLLVVPATVVENDNDGNYTLTFAAQTATDVMRITLLQDGYESNAETFIAV